MQTTSRLLLYLFSLCGGAIFAEDEPMWVYFGTERGEQSGIYRAAFEPKSGELSPATLAADIGAPGFLALHPDGDKLYAVAHLPEGHGVAGYRMAPDGSLAVINTMPIGDGKGVHLAVHPSGKFLLTAQYGTGSVAFFPLDRDGRLGAAIVSKHAGGSGIVKGRQDAPHAHWCGYSPDGRFALVSDLGMDGIVVYAVDLKTPAIKPHGFIASVPGGGARHMRFSSNGRFIYLLNELTLSVTTFEWNASAGTATKRSTVPALTEAQLAENEFNSGAEILVHPAQPVVYSSNRGHDSISVYRENPETGSLEIDQVQPAGVAWPRNINLSPSGDWLFAAGAHSNTVAVHAVDPIFGRLSHQPDRTITVPRPICILFKE